jgi:acetyl-CoA acetyltransferase family protein
MNAIGNVADGIKAGSIQLAIAGGVESMSRAPFVMAKQSAAFGRNTELYDTTLGWRFINKKLEDAHGSDAMAETAENVAEEFGVSREDQDGMALRSQLRAEAAIKGGVFNDEIIAVNVPQRRGDPLCVDTDEHPRAGSTIEGLAKLRPIVRKDGSITAGNASGINDGACALLIANEASAAAAGLEPLARVVAWAVAGVPPRIMGIGPVPAIQKLCQRAGRKLEDFDLFELNEAFAAQVLACLHDLPISRDKLNVNGGAIALGHPIGATGARIVVTLVHELARRDQKRGLASLCMSGGMGMAMEFER